MNKAFLFRRVFPLLGILSILSFAAAAVWAWQSSIVYSHNSRYGGEAESGWHRGQVEYSGGKRYARAGDDNVYWTVNQVAWIFQHASSSKRPALVYHAFKPNTNDCSKIRVMSKGYSWSNLPMWDFYSKGCGPARDNEVRFLIYGWSSLVAQRLYYIQHLFEDTAYPGTKTHAEITTDSYWDVDPNHWGQYNDYHCKFCVVDNSTVNPTNGVCPP